MTELATAPMVTNNDTDFSQELSQSSEGSIPTASPSVQNAGLNLLELLNAERIEPVSNDSLATINPSSLNDLTTTPMSLGDEILARLDAIGADYKANVARAYTTLEKSPRENTVEDLLKMQLDIAVVSLEVEVVGKGVQKSVQHIDTLSKMN
jgi:hypothetical protein